jgi:hypothetical protein
MIYWQARFEPPTAALPYLGWINLIMYIILKSPVAYLPPGLVATQDAYEEFQNRVSVWTCRAVYFQRSQ